MNEDFEKEDSFVPPQEEQQVLALVKRLQQQVIFLEKKIDILLSRSAQRPNETRNFSKPSYSFGHSQRQGKTRYRDHSRERDFSAGHFDKRHGEESRGSEQREKPFHPFDKRREGSRRPDEGSRRPGQRNKPFFRRRRERS
ncbi:MAG: hypothetical protein ABH954_03615 [Candidatus Omnitrophota bacterium]